jgi:glycosyltransferase involved in cell wall biosynthesis
MSDEPARARLRIGIDARRYLSQSGGIASLTKGLVSNLVKVDPSNEYMFLYQRLGKLVDRGFPFSIAVPVLVDYGHKQLILPILLALHKTDVLLCLTQPGPVWAPCPTVVYVPDIPADFETGALLSKSLANLIIPVTARRATHIVTISEYTKRDIIKKLGAPPGKISVVYPGVDPVRFQPIQRAEASRVISQRHQLKRQILLTVLSSFAPRKNLPGLVEAYSLLPDRTRQHVSLVVVGPSNGWLNIRRELSERVPQDVLDSIVVTGYLEDHLLPYYYSASDIFVFPSLHEGFGLPVVEAMACGTSVICSNAASLPEVVGDAGILVDPRSGAEMANAIADLLDDDARRTRLSEAGHARARMFTPEGEALQLLHVLWQTARRK